MVTASVESRNARQTFYSGAKPIDVEAAQFIQGHPDQSMRSWYDHIGAAKWRVLKDVCGWTSATGGDVQVDTAKSLPWAINCHL